MSRGVRGAGCRYEAFWVMADRKEPMSAYKIARKIGYSPQQVNRVLAKMWHSGSVCYKVVKHGKGQKRLWVTARVAEQDIGGEWVCAYDKVLV